MICVKFVLYFMPPKYFRWIGICPGSHSWRRQKYHRPGQKFQLVCSGCGEASQVGIAWKCGGGSFGYVVIFSEPGSGTLAIHVHAEKFDIMFSVFGHRYLARTNYPQPTYFVGLTQPLFSPYFMAFNPALGRLERQTNLTGSDYGHPAGMVAGVEVPLAYFDQCMDLP